LIEPPPVTIFGSSVLEVAKDLCAVVLAALGLVLRGAVIGYAYIKRGGLNKKVYAKSLVTDGMFGVSRNPIYLGNIMIYSGVFLMHGNPLIIAAGIGIFLFGYVCLVAAEEAYLMEKFGDEYRAYCAQVPRWLPDWSRFKSSTEGMEFNVARALIKDYSTIATTIVAFTLTEGYEILPTLTQQHGYLVFLGSVLILCGLGVVGIRMLKKAQVLVS